MGGIRTDNHAANDVIHPDILTVFKGEAAKALRLLKSVRPI